MAATHTHRRYHTALRRLLLLCLSLATMSTASSPPSQESGGGGGSIGSPPFGTRGRLSPTRRRPVVVRLHLVRHGQAESNRDGLVLGSRESPLTDLGVRQARALGRSSNYGGAVGGKGGEEGAGRYWRAYCSDLGRARRTAGFVLGLEGEEGGGNKTEGGVEGSTTAVNEVEGGGGADQCRETLTTPRPDPRLRERAKGVREGMPKSLTYDEAMRLYVARDGYDKEAPLPHLETDDEVWDRVRRWIEDVLRDAEAEAEAEATECASAEGEDAGTADSSPSAYEALLASHGSSDTPPPTRRFDVLAVSHSATIRTAVSRLVGGQLPSHVSTGPVGRDGTARNMLIIPNTSVTVVDVVPSAEGSGGAATSFLANLVTLTDATHLELLD